MKRAPWWAYLVPFLALNYARIALVETSTAGDVALALAAAALVLGGLGLLADDPEPLYGWFGTLAVICGGWLVFGPLWPSRRKEPA